MNSSVWMGRLREIALGLLLGGACLFIVSQGLSRAEAGSRLEDPQMRAIREGNRLLDRLSADVARGPSECRMLRNGVALCKADSPQSPVVTYTWSARSGQVSRADGTGARVVAHGITAFAVATNPDGRLVVTVEASRARESHRRTVRLQPVARSS